MALRACKGTLVEIRVFPAATALLSSFGLDRDGRLHSVSLSGGTIHPMVQTA